MGRRIAQGLRGGTQATCSGGSMGRAGGTGRTLEAGGLLVGLLVVGLVACAPPAPPPSLQANLPPQASDVPLDTAVSVTATSAVLDSAALERLDGAGAVPALNVDESAARLSGP